MISFGPPRKQAHVAVLGAAAIFAGGNLAAAARGDDTQRLAEIQDALRSERAAITSIVVQETVSERFPDISGEMQVAVDRLRAEAERSQQFALDRAAGDAAMIRAAQEAYAIKVSGLERWPTVLRLNKTILVSRKRTVDFAGSRARLDDADLRDVARIVRDHSLTEVERQQLDQTQVRLTAAQRNAAISPTGSAFVTGLDLFSPADEHLVLGILPAQFFDLRLQFTIRDVLDDGQPAVELTGRLPNESFDRVLVVLRPDRGHRLSRLTMSRNKGEPLQSFIAEDYQHVGGRWIPFHTRKQRALRVAADYHIVDRLVSLAVINPATPDELFRIPDGCNVTDARGAERTP